MKTRVYLWPDTDPRQFLELFFKVFILRNNNNENFIVSEVKSWPQITLHNRLQERCLRIVYTDTYSTFEELLVFDGSIKFHERALQLLAI